MTRNEDWNEARLQRLENRIERLERRSFESWNFVIQVMAWIPAIAIWVFVLTRAVTN